VSKASYPRPEPQDVNALSASLVEIFQGQGTSVQSLLSQTSSLTNHMAEHNQVVGQVIDHLRDVLSTLSNSGDDFSAAVDRRDQAVNGLAADRDPIGDAIDALDRGTASLADLLNEARTPLAGTVEQVNRLAPSLELKKDRVDTMLGKLPEDYRKLARIGSYGSFINYYACSISVRVTDLQGRTAVFRWCHRTAGGVPSLMLKYRGRLRSGFIGAVLILQIIAVGLAPERLLVVGNFDPLCRAFAEASNIAVGNTVTMSGMKVGTVSDVSLSTVTLW